jgi:SAM-dependent methyltransferase
LTEALFGARRSVSNASWLFPAAIFISASLVFLVQPMLAKMLLPKLGGSPAVWNTSMVFFQAALLVGYVYAHLLQRLRNLKREAAIHLCVLAAASVFLPLTITGRLGEPPSSAPALWLLAALTLSVAAPFSVLSATAPLMQSWYARLRRAEPGPPNPYTLYVASNVGSMLALLAYPIVVEPLLPLGDQGRAWTVGYATFCALAAGLAWTIFREGEQSIADRPAPARALGALSLKTRLVWILLAAAPSSLMLGTTTFISTDVAAAPFLWVAPLALYLLTFIIAFQARPMISERAARLGQGLLAPLCLVSMVGTGANWWLVLVLHATAFFFSALVCHQAVSARRPETGRLTEFYLFVSIGGVVGGAVTALLAPVIFNFVLEYPLVLILAAFARPTMLGKADRADWAVLGIAILCTLIIAGFSVRGGIPTLAVIVCLTLSSSAAVLLRPRTRLFAVALAAVAVQALICGGASTDLHTARSFFGVHRVKLGHEPALGGDVHILAHGTTIHGAQPLAPAFRCRPTNYYAPQGAIGQTYGGMQAARPHLRIGVVGLGGGSVATYMRASDTLRFFEIDPEVERIARDRRYFTYLGDCAKGPVEVVLGDARLTLGYEPPASYDLLHLDAFTSDAIPTHLMTVEALEQYLRVLKPDGVLLLHISNRHLALEGIAAAAAERLGATAIVQNYRPPKGTPGLVINATDVMLVSRSPEALATFRQDPRWRAAEVNGAAAWTDDHTNLIAALLEHAFEKPLRSAAAR